MEKGRKIGFSGYFATYLFSIFTAFCFIGILSYLLILGLPKILGVLPANHTENEIRESYSLLESMIPFSPDVLPSGTRYLLLDDNQVPLEGTITKEEIVDIENSNFGGVKDSYLIRIPRDNETLIISYAMKTRFQNKTLDGIISPFVMFIIVIGLLLVSSLLIVTILFSSKLKKQLQPLKVITEHIAKQDMNFVANPSKIKEFSEIQDSLYSMRDSLWEALENEWEQEQRGKEQIMALAHDIKTPLTVVQGNADLLEDDIVTEENKIYFSYLQTGIFQIEKYLETLQELSADSTWVDLQLEHRELNQFSQVIIDLARAYCDTKAIKLEPNISLYSEYVRIDQQKMERCIMNIVSNAVNHSPKKGRIYLTILEQDNKVLISIEDEGDGFSEQDLRHAKDKFYMGESSRTATGHFGFGLYIANNIITVHGGSLLLENSDAHNGGKVTVTFPNK